MLPTPVSIQHPQGDELLVGHLQPLLLIGGPCALESEDLARRVAGEMSDICQSLGISYIFKASFDKANRTSLSSFRGPGLEKGLSILDRIRSQLGVPVVSDIHEPSQAAVAAEVLDILQIPAFLCRQTELLVAAAHTNKVINIKKGQFLSPESMIFAINKVRKSGNDQVWITERGTTFGYQDLVVDYRGIPKMQKMNVPVILDCTHSLQQPNQFEGVTGGQPQLIETIAKAGIAVGTDGIFIETHPEPSVARSDGANMLKLDLLEALLEKLIRIRKAISDSF